MLKVTGSGQTQTCDGLSRRDFMQVGALGAAGLALPNYLAARQVGDIKPGHDERSCIMIFNLGAPSQLDLFDMKPNASAEIRGPFSPISTAVPDMQISELLPGHARIADKFSIVRSCHHNGAAVHDAGWQMMQTGRQFQAGMHSPHAGAVASYLKGRKSELPPFVVLPELMGRGGGNLPNGQAGGFLGTAYNPFALNADPSKKNFRTPNRLPASGIGEVRLERRRKLKDVVDQTLANFEASGDADRMSNSAAEAYQTMATPQARDAFDLSKEPYSVRQRYGMNRFGQSCLLARRLVEAGVRFVTVNTFLTVFDEVTWDIHGTKPFTTIEGMQKLVCPMYDQAYTALIEDLSERGLLDATLVANIAEFGRTPRINPAGGRDHWPGCFSVYFAGGGVRGGQVIGASDAIGSAPVERAVGPEEVVATIYRSLGYNLDTQIPGPGGQSLPLIDAGHREIHELF